MTIRTEVRVLAAAVAAMNICSQRGMGREYQFIPTMAVLSDQRRFVFWRSNPSHIQFHPEDSPGVIGARNQATCRRKVKCSVYAGRRHHNTNVNELTSSNCFHLLSSITTAELVETAVGLQSVHGVKR